MNDQIGNIERRLKIYILAVEALKERQKALGRESWKSDDALSKAWLAEWRNQNILPRFIGYDPSLLRQQEAKIVALETAKKGKKTTVTVAIDPCPFYGLGGGQVPDTGTITLGNGHEWNVTDVFQPYEGGLALRLTPKDSKDIDRRIQEDQDFLKARFLCPFSYINVNHGY